MFTEAEPNNSTVQAQPVTFGTEIQAQWTTGDIDYFQFTLSVTSHVMLFTGTNDPTLDTELLLEDVAGFTLAYDADSRGLSAALSIELPPGTYRAKVTATSPQAFADYTFEVARTSPRTVTLTENATTEVANNTRAGATLLPSGPCRVTVDAQRLTAGDEDWYRLSFNVRTGLWITINEGNGKWISQHRWELYDANGSLVSARYGPSSGNSPEDPSNADKEKRTSQIRVWEGQTYYVRVLENAGCSPNCSSTSGYNEIPYGAYRLTVISAPMAGAGQVAHGGTATGIAGGQVGTGILPAPTLGNPIPKHAWTIIAPSACVVFLQTFPGSGTALNDSTIRISDSQGWAASSAAGNVLENPQNPLHARLAVTLPSAGNYTVEVTGGPLNAGGGSYLLEVGLAACAISYSVPIYGIFSNANCGTGQILYASNPSEVPVLGSLLVTRAYFAASTGLVVRLLDLQVMPVPFDLTSIGAPGCFLVIQGLATELALSSPPGAYFSLAIPSSPAFLGIQVYDQVVGFDLFSFGVGASDALRYTICSSPF